MCGCGDAVPVDDRRKIRRQKGEDILVLGIVFNIAKVRGKDFFL